jgi:transposase
MLVGRPKPTLELSAGERVELSGFGASRSLPHALVSRAKLVLWSGEVVSNSEIAEHLDSSKAKVGKWLQRFIGYRIPGLYDELRPGRSRTISDENVASLLRRTIKTKPPAGTHSPNELIRRIEEFVRHYNRQIPPICLDCHRFDLSETHSTLFAYLRDHSN